MLSCAIHCVRIGVRSLEDVSGSRSVTQTTQSNKLRLPSTFSQKQKSLAILVRVRWKWMGNTGHSATFGVNPAGVGREGWNLQWKAVRSGIIFVGQTEEYKSTDQTLKITKTKQHQCFPRQLFAWVWVYRYIARDLHSPKNLNDGPVRVWFQRCCFKSTVLLIPKFCNYKERIHFPSTIKWYFVIKDCRQHCHFYTTRFWFVLIGRCLPYQEKFNKFTKVWAHVLFQLQGKQAIDGCLLCVNPSHCSSLFYRETWKAVAQQKILYGVYPDK